MRRLLKLSSITSARTPLSITVTAEIFWPGHRSGLEVRGKMKDAAASQLTLDPYPAAHQRDQPATIARPSPLPPYWRVAEESAWVKLEKTSSSLSGAIPMPVSAMEK